MERPAAGRARQFGGPGFLLGDAVGCAGAGQKVPDGY